MGSEISSTSTRPTALESKVQDIQIIRVKSEKGLDCQAASPPRDKRNPHSFGKKRKWMITVVTSLFTFLVSASAVSFNLGQPSMIRELGCTSFQATLGLSRYCLGFGVFPLFTSAFSEEFGRQPLYYISIVGFLMHLVVGLSRSIQPILVSRFIQGALGSTGAITVAGTIADIWSPQERGLPMSLYSFIAFAGNGVGGMAGGWIEVNHDLGWKWIQWVHLILGGIYLLVFIPVVKETRVSVILRTKGKMARQATGSFPNLSVEKRNRREMLYTSCTRPILLLFTEPIAFAVSIWIGFAWGVYYCMIGSVPGIFRTLHGFSQGETGSVYMTMVVGSLIGFFTNLYQEKLYQKNVMKRGTQARLYLSCVAGFLFPLSMFILAWSSSRAVPWVVLVVSLTVYVWAVFTIYLAVFTYLADCYGKYASSALAGQSLFRNIMATIFPLFSDRMFATLGYKWANTIFASAALIMSPIPIVLFFRGAEILSRSRTVRTIAEAEGEENSQEGTAARLQVR